jgi:hypothetical protein
MKPGGLGTSTARYSPATTTPHVGFHIRELNSRARNCATEGGSRSQIAGTSFGATAPGASRSCFAPAVKEIWAEKKADDT